MRRLLTGLIVGGMFPALFALAQSSVDTGDFEQEHAGQLPEEVALPGAEQKSDDELTQEYTAALQAVERQQAPGDATASPEPAVPENMAEQVLELPFAVLERDLDSDGDGLSNADEDFLGTDVRHPDTDGDGYIDGLEIVRAYNPLTPSPDDKVSYAAADPSAAPASSSLSVSGVHLDRQDDRDVLVITGAGLSDRLVTLFVFSEPRAVLLRADASERFRIVVDDTLEEGEHTAYAALTGPGGEILEASAPYTFARTAAGITGPAVQPVEAEPLPETAGASRTLLIAGIGAAILLGSLMVVGTVVLWRKSRRQKRESSEESSIIEVPPDL